MRFPPLLITLALLSSCLTGQAEIKAEHQKVIEHLLEERDPAAFEKACTDAALAGVPRQAVLEAKFLYLIDVGDRARLAALSDELAASEKDFNIEDSIVFSVPEDFSAIVEYTRALRALENNKPDEFKKHITEAFWLSPKQSQVFGQHVERQRLVEIMSQLVIDLDADYALLLKPEEKTSLRAQLADSPALLLHFWSPWSPEAETSLPDFRKTTLELKKQKIPVVSILFNGPEEVLADARLFAKGQAMNIPTTWLLDQRKNSLAHKLRILQLPTFVLLSPDGKILFNGDPSQEDLWLEIKKLAPNFIRPDSFRNPDAFRSPE